jgi:hypothetical protein
MRWFNKSSRQSARHGLKVAIEEDSKIKRILANEFIGLRFTPACMIKDDGDLS